MPPPARGGGRRKRSSAKDGEECTVDAVIAEAYNASTGARFFLVAWAALEGKPQPKATWEPESNLAGAQEAIAEFTQNSRTPLAAEKQSMQSDLDRATNTGVITVTIVDDSDHEAAASTGAAAANAASSQP